MSNLVVLALVASLASPVNAVEPDTAIKSTSAEVGSVSSVAGVESRGIRRGAYRTFVPERWNGKKVFLSQACHNNKAGKCRDNIGCQSFSENDNSWRIARASVYGSKWQQGFLERGYKVYIGYGRRSENIRNANGLGVHLYIPLHTNAAGAGSCKTGKGLGKRRGFVGIHHKRSSKGKACVKDLKRFYRHRTPGTKDRIYADRRGLQEINGPKAPTCYVESEFHDWNKGVNWLKEYRSWAWVISGAVDSHLGYPRS